MAVLLVALQTVALKLSPHFAYSISLVRQPVIAWVALQVLAGACYLYGCRQLHRLRERWALLALIVATGLLMRGLMAVSTPVLETDFYRYLWDGAMLANGLDPYAHAPDTIRSGAEQIPDAAVRLAAASQPVLDRVNHPDVTTIYPPVAISAFALAHLIDPWSLGALRGIYLAFDLATLGLLAGLLRQRGLSLAWLFIYWCNPLLVRAVYNALHMDLIVVCFVTLLIFGMVRRRALTCAVALAAATGAKIWPALLGAHLWWREGMSRAAVAGLAMGAVVLSPMLAGSWHGGSGLLAYAGSWEVNDPVYRFIAAPLRWAAETEATASWLARALSAALFVWCLFHFYGKKHAHRDEVELLLMAIGAFLVLQPAAYPWYFLWLLPLLVLQPASAWLALSASLPLYDLRFFFEPRELAAWFDFVVVPIEFSPLLLLFWRRRAGVS